MPRCATDDGDTAFPGASRAQLLFSRLSGWSLLFLLTYCLPLLFCCFLQALQKDVIGLLAGLLDGSLARADQILLDCLVDAGQVFLDLLNILL